MNPIKNAASKIFISPLKVLASERSQPFRKIISGIAVGIFSIVSLGYYTVFAVGYYQRRKFEQKKDDLKGLSPVSQSIKNEKEDDLLAAVNTNDVEKAKTLISDNPNLVKISGKKGMGTLFTEIVISGNCEMAELFLKHSAEPDQSNRLGGTLQSAIILGNIKMVKLLQKYGSELPNNPLQLLYAAADYGNNEGISENPDFPEIVDWLIKEADMDINKKSPYFKLIKDLDNPYAKQIQQTLELRGVKFE